MIHENRFPCDMFSHNQMMKMYVILDLDETLVHTGSPEEAINPTLPIHSKFRLGGNDYVFVVRPYFQEFITFLLRNNIPFMIWSAGQRDYVEAVVSRIFAPFGFMPLIKAHDETYPMLLVDDGEIYKTTTKPLEALFREFPFMNITNTIMVDDNPDYLAFNRGNQILIPKLSFQSSPSDDSLLQIMRGLTLAQRAGNVQILSGMFR